MRIRCRWVAATAAECRKRCFRTVLCTSESPKTLVASLNRSWMVTLPSSSTRRNLYSKEGSVNTIQNRQDVKSSTLSDKTTIHLLQYRPMEQGGKQGKHATWLTVATTKDKNSQWTETETNIPRKASKSATKDVKVNFLFGAIHSSFQSHVLTHFLPAQYPASVSPGYARFALYAFAAAVAGSGAMVLSTQTLLLAVGILGSQQQTQQAAANVSVGIMAGALNWVLKDGMGQLGGVLFASQMGRLRHVNFDSHPKQWRVVSAASLDVANLVEIAAPFVALHWVLPLACGANILKNIGFLTASASRAALHQSLCRAGNLADVTAKAGTQSMAAGLLGTALGISLSAFVLGQHDPSNFILGFCALSAIHQGCNYASLQHVHLNYFNRQRLDIVLRHYVLEHAVLSPSQVAQRESYFPFLSSTSVAGAAAAADSFSSMTWLRIGSPIQTLAPNGVQQWEALMALELFAQERYILNTTIAAADNHGKTTRTIHVTFWDTATGQDVIRGLLHAHLLHYGNNNDLTQQGNNDDLVEEAVYTSYQQLKIQGETLLTELHNLDWVTKDGTTHVEPYGAVRFCSLDLDNTGGESITAAQKSGLSSLE